MVDSAVFAIAFVIFGVLCTGCSIALAALYLYYERVNSNRPDQRLTFSQSAPTDSDRTHASPYFERSNMTSSLTEQHTLMPRDDAPEIELEERKRNNRGPPIDESSVTLDIECAKESRPTFLDLSLVQPEVEQYWSQKYQFSSNEKREHL